MVFARLFVFLFCFLFLLAFSPLFCVFACNGCGYGTRSVLSAKWKYTFSSIVFGWKRETNKRTARNTHRKREEAAAAAKRMWCCMSAVGTNTHTDTAIHRQTHAGTDRRMRTRSCTLTNTDRHADTYLMRSGRRSRTFGCGFFSVLNGDNTTVHANINSVDSSIGCDCVFSSGVCATLRIVYGRDVNRRKIKTKQKNYYLPMFGWRWRKLYIKYGKMYEGKRSKSRRDAGLKERTV